MRKGFLLTRVIFFSLICTAQKKPLDHTAYDAWQSIGEQYISNNGKWVVYTINPQQGDGELVIQSADGSYKKSIPRGYNPVIASDSRFIAFKIKPLYQQTRQARISKKKADQMPKDSAALVELGKDSVMKLARVKALGMPEKSAGWVAYHLEPVPRPSATSDSLRPKPVAADSLQRIIDSLNNRINTGKRKVEGYNDEASIPESTDADEDGNDAAAEQEPSDLVLYNTHTGKSQVFPLVSAYIFNKTGTVLVMETGINRKDSLRNRAAVVWYSLENQKANTIAHSGNDFRNFAMDEEGKQLVFIAERDSSKKSLQKFYKLWYYTPGMDSAAARIDRNNAAITKGFTVSENAIPYFSKSGLKVFFGTAPVLKPKDTTLVDFETVRMDIWNYNDDYLQPQQLKRAETELKRSYLAVYYPADNKVVQLGAPDAETVIPAEAGNSDFALVTTTFNHRKEAQWKGQSPETAYVLNMKTGVRKLIKDSLEGFFNLSPFGRYILWYDQKKRAYYTYSTATGQTSNISAKIGVPMYDETDDHPDYPPAHGFMKWHDQDKYVYLYDKYDIWKVDPTALERPVMLTGGSGRKNRVTYRYINVDREERFLRQGQKVLLSVLAEADRTNGFMLYKMGDTITAGEKPSTFAVNYSNFFKAKSAEVYGFLKSSYGLSRAVTLIAAMDSVSTANRTRYTVKESAPLTALNPQQEAYNWFTAELIRWKMFDGKQSQGILYKPENFTPGRKYPIIFYFYERNSDSMYAYINPQPMGSTINIPYYTSNGYIVLDCNIYYKRGEPGESAYNAVVSAAKYMSTFNWIDSKKMGLQGHSWGGYQVAYLITRTNSLFAAAEAGAPVANMTSAYGGIRWSTGVSRAFQYERTQSRIGATLWERPDLYIKNSPLFRADKIQTPLLMMHNDADGAVPWYQGIEFFSALKRLGKKAWLVQYNGEDHNLVERKNRKDWAIRMSQFFDHFLKDAPAPRWMVQGIPATEKGKEWGLSLEK